MAKKSPIRGPAKKSAATTTAEPEDTAENWPPILRPARGPRSVPHSRIVKAVNKVIRDRARTDG